MNALRRFAELAEADPDAPFLAVDAWELTRGAFIDQVARGADALQQAGVGLGDVVVLCGPNSLEWCVAFWAAVSLGAVPAPIDPASGVWELRQLLTVLRPRLAVATTSFRGADLASRLRQVWPNCPLVTFESSPSFVGWRAWLEASSPRPLGLREVGEDELLLFACTSGTTGNPKILAIAHRGFARAQHQMAEFLGFGPTERVLLGMPLFHQGGFGMGLQVLLAGGQARYLQTFEPRAYLERLRADGVTVAQLSPTLAKLLVTVPGFDAQVPRHWRMAYFAGEVLSDDLAARFWRDHHIRTINVVGSSETGTMLCWDSAHDCAVSPSDLAELPFTRARVADQDGRPIPDDETGLLWVTTEGLFLRYEGNETLTRASLRLEQGGRWYRTGDLVRKLPDGRFRFAGRAQRVVKRGPNLVHPEELEAFLLGHPSIAAIAVAGEPHEVFGERLVAKIQAAPGVVLTRRDVVEFCRGQIASFKIPDQIHFVDALPADVGKVQHLRLRTGDRPSMNDVIAPVVATSPSEPNVAALTDPSMPTLATTLDEHYDAARQRLPADHTIVMDEDRPVSFEEFQLTVRRLVHGLRAAGLAPGEVVGYSVPNGLAAFTLPLSLSRLGAICLPMVPMIPDAARCGAFAQARARFVVVPREASESFAATAENQRAPFALLILEDLLQADAAPLPAGLARPESPFLLTSSSGTTGVPKTVLLNQRNTATAVSAALDLSAYGPWEAAPKYRSMIAFPQSSSGIMMLLGIAFAGVCQIFTRSLSPARYLEIAHATGAQALAAPPAWLEAILSVPPTKDQQASTVRAVATGMDFLAPSLLQRLAARFPALEAVANGYGLVETATVFMRWKGSGRSALEGPTNVLSLTPGLGNEHSVRDEAGTPVALGEEGELWVRGPSVVAGYLGSSEGFQDGWFRTGDVVRSIDATTVELRGRRKYLIKRGGKSISPLVVQEAVDKTPGVRQSAVVGIPHPLYGEMVWAFVVREPPGDGDQRQAHPVAEMATVMRTVRALLPAHMVPDRVEFVEAIPRGRGVGKVDREALIAQGSAILRDLGV